MKKKKKDKVCKIVNNGALKLLFHKSFVLLRIKRL